MNSVELKVNCGILGISGKFGNEIPNSKANIISSDVLEIDQVIDALNKTGTTVFLIALCYIIIVYKLA